LTVEPPTFESVVMARGTTVAHPDLVFFRPLLGFAEIVGHLAHLHQLSCVEQRLGIEDDLIRLVVSLLGSRVSHCAPLSDGPKKPCVWTGWGSRPQVFPARLLAVRLGAEPPAGEHCLRPGFLSPVARAPAGLVRVA